MILFTDVVGQCELTGCNRDVDVGCKMCHTFLCYRLDFIHNAALE